MKKVIKNIKKVTLLVALSATMLSNASETPTFILNNEAKGTSLTIENVKEGNQLSIVDNHGVTLFKEKIQKSGVYTKGFDLTTLPNGNYFFELDKDLEINTIPFNVKNSIVVFNKEKEVTVFKPYTWVKNNRVYFTKLSLNQAPLEIKIYYKGEQGHSNSELIFSETIENTKIIERAYKLSKDGSYTIIYNTDNKEYTKHINI